VELYAGLESLNFNGKLGGNWGFWELPKSGDPGGIQNPRNLGNGYGLSKNATEKLWSSPGHILQIPRKGGKTQKSGKGGYNFGIGAANCSIFFRNWGYQA